jgi:hypothetical protein
MAQIRDGFLVADVTGDAVKRGANRIGPAPDSSPGAPRPPQQQQQQR